MSISENHPPGHQDNLYSSGWHRFEGVVTFGVHFSNYRTTLQDRVLVIPLGRIYQPTDNFLESGFWQSLCSDCRSSINPDLSVGSLERLPCVVTLTPHSALRLSGGGDTNALIVSCSCENAPHSVPRPRPIRPDRRTTLRLVLL